MSIVLTYIAVAAAVVGIIGACVVFIVNLQRSEQRLSQLAGLACAFIVAGFFFGSNRLLGFSLMGIGACLALMNLLYSAKRA